MSLLRIAPFLFACFSLPAGADQGTISVRGIGRAKGATAGFSLTIDVRGLAKTLGAARTAFDVDIRSITEEADALAVAGVGFERGDTAFEMIPAGRRAGSGQVMPTMQFAVGETVVFRDAAAPDAAAEFLTAATALLDGLAARGIVGCKWPDPRQYYSTSNFSDARTTAARYVSQLFLTLSFEAEREDALELEATRAAVADARAHAEFLAELTEVELGPVLHLTSRNLRVHWIRTSTSIECSVDVDLQFAIVDSFPDELSTVSVSGDGSVTANPEFMELVFVNKVGGDSAKGAVKDLGSRRHSLEKILAGSEFEHSPLESTGVVLHARRRGTETNSMTRRYMSLQEHLGIHAPAGGDLCAGEVLTTRIGGVGERDSKWRLDTHTTILDNLIEAELLEGSTNAPSAAIPQAAIRYSVEDTAAREREALANAVDSARKRARHAAGALGQVVGPVLNVKGRKVTWSGDPDECRCEAHIDVVFAVSD